jgi:hypothetical protein
MKQIRRLFNATPGRPPCILDPSNVWTGLDSVLAFDFIFVQQPDFFFSSSLSTSNTKLSFWNIYLIVISEIDFFFFFFFYFFQSCFDRPTRSYCAPTIDRNPDCVYCVQDLGKYKGQSQSRWSHLVMGARLYCSGKQFSTKVQSFLNCPFEFFNSR